MRTTLPTALALLAVASLTLTGCGTQAEEYSSVTELAADWEDYSGQDCQDTPSNGSMACNDSVLLAVYQNEEEMEAHHEELREVYPASFENKMLAGPNWTANVSDDELEALKKEIGGKIITIKGKD